MLRRIRVHEIGRGPPILAAPEGRETEVKSRSWLKRGVPIFACALAFCLWAPHARAEDLGNHLYDRFQATASGSFLWLGSDVRVDSKNGSAGTDVDVEDDLGMPDTRLQPRLAFRWQPGRKHQLELGYQFARRSGSNTLDRTIEVGDTSFTAGAQVNAAFNTDNAFLTYRFAFVADERKQLGVGLGLGSFFFKVEVDALADVASGGQSGSVSYSGGTSFLGPTAALGLFGRFRSGDRWYLEPDVRYLRVKIDRITGQVLEGSLVTRYYISPKVGIEGGLGVKTVQVDLGPKNEGGTNPGISARVKYRESQIRLGVVLPL